MLLLTLYTPNLWAWPTDGDWIPIYRGNDMLIDPDDAAGSRDIVGDARNSAAYLFNDGNYIYFRIRIADDPLQNPTELQPFGWGFLLDTNLSLDDYEYMIMLNGITNPETMYLAKNTFQGIIGDPSDKAEQVLWEENLVINNNFRVLSPGDFGAPTTTLGGPGDYYLDWFIPYAVFKSSMGLDDGSVLRYFVGSSNAAQTLSADLVAGSTLYAGSSNYVLPSGKQPETGGVYFVSNASGLTDLTQFYAGTTVYIKVIDADLNTADSTIQSLDVLVSAPSGDSQIVTLTETSATSGIFIGSLATDVAAPVSADGILQVSPIEIVTVLYLDAADASTPPLTNQPRIDTVQALPSADIGIEKTISRSTPTEGDTIFYTVRATNYGPSAAIGVQVTDLLPAGVTYVAHTTPVGTSYNPGTGLWSVGSLTPDAFKELVITVTVNTGTAKTTIINTATRSAASQPDPNSANNSASASLAVIGSDLRLTKVSSDVTPGIGETVTFTLQISNDGVNEATNITITDLLPIATWSSVTLVSATLGTWSYVGGTGEWDIPSLPFLANATLIINATLAPAVGNGTSVTNTATITHVDQADPSTADNTASVTMIVGGIDLALSKVVTSPSPATPDVGGTVVFRVTVTNNSSSTTATGIQITDPVPNYLNYVSALPSVGNYVSGTTRWSGFSLAPGASATLDLTYTVASGSAGFTLINQAQITAYNEMDIDTSNHTATASVIVRATDIEVIKTVNNPTPAANPGTVVYTIVVTNRGLINASGVTIFDQLPGATTYVSQTTTQGSYSTATKLWTVGNLAVNASATLTITASYNLANNDSRTFFNTASYQSSTPVDNNIANNVSTAVVSVSGTDLGLSKVMNTGYTTYPTTGTTTQFLITVTNYGPNIATGIDIRDQLPIGFACTSGVPDLGSFATAQCKWTIPTLAIGASATLVLTSAVTAPAGSVRTNTVAIYDVNQADPNAGNNSAAITLYVGASDLGITKTVNNPTPSEGEIVTFTLTLTNNGPNSLTGLAVTDYLPSGMTLITTGINAPVLSQGSFNSATGLWTVGTVNFPGTATLALSFTVNTGTAGSQLTNSTQITAFGGMIDPIPANNVASASVYVQLADIYVTKYADTLTPYVGGTVTFTIEVGNSGPHSTNGLVIRDLLATKPDSFPTPDPVFSNPTFTPSVGTSYDPLSGNWTIGTLAKDAIATLTMTVTINAGAEGKGITNHAYVLSSGQTDNNLLNNEQSVIITPRLLSIDLRLTKAAPAVAPVEGANMIFTLTLYNLHPSESATGLVVTDTLPTGLTFVAAAPSVGSITSAPAVGSSGAVVWTIGPLAAMSNVTLVLTAKTACGSAATLYTNSATISAHDQLDLILGNNTATADVTPTAAAPMLMVLKSATHTVSGNPITSAAPGQVITYTVQVQNTGCGKATSVTLNDHMSPYTAWQLDYNHDGAPDESFNFAPATSGLTIDNLDFSLDGGTTWGATPISANGGVPIGYDGTITNWKIEMTGEMGFGGNFILRYRAMVK